MILNLLQINYLAHHVHVSRDTETDRIILFKYNDSRCDFGTFSSKEWDEAADFVLTPLPEGSWGFEADEDEE